MSVKVNGRQERWKKQSYKLTDMLRVSVLVKKTSGKHENVISIVSCQSSAKTQLGTTERHLPYAVAWYIIGSNKCNNMRTLQHQYLAENLLSIFNCCLHSRIGGELWISVYFTTMLNLPR